MQANDFENKIKSQLDDFTLVPKEEVWDLVAARIAKEKKRRGVFFWLFGLATMIIGFSTWSIVKYTGKKEMTAGLMSPKIAEKLETNVTAQPFAGSNKKDETKEIAVEKYSKEPPLFERKSKQSGKIEEATSEKSNHKNDYNKQKGNSFLGEADKNNNETNTLKSQKQKSNVSKIEGENGNHEIVQETKFLSSKQQNVIPGEIKDSSSIENSIAKEDVKKLSVSNANTVKKSSQSLVSRKGWRMGITAFAGISNNQPGIRWGNKQEVNSSPQPNTTGGLNSTFRNMQYSASFSFGGGIFAVKQLSDKIGISIGGNYHFYQANSSVGSIMNGMLNQVDPILQNQFTVSQYYTFGYSYQFTNKYHFVEMPIQISYRLNKYKERPIAITGSLIPGYLIGSSALYNNGNSGVYYKEKKQFNQFQLSTSVGLMFTLKKPFNNRFSIGPVFQYNLTNLTKKQLQSNQHLLFAGIKTNFIFK